MGGGGDKPKSQRIQNVETAQQAFIGGETVLEEMRRLQAAGQRGVAGRPGVFLPQAIREEEAFLALSEEEQKVIREKQAAATRSRSPQGEEQRLVLGETVLDRLRRFQKAGVRGVAGKPGVFIPEEIAREEEIFKRREELEAAKAASEAASEAAAKAEVKTREEKLEAQRKIKKETDIKKAKEVKRQNIVLEAAGKPRTEPREAKLTAKVEEEKVVIAKRKKAEKSARRRGLRGRRSLLGGGGFIGFSPEDIVTKGFL